MLPASWNVFLGANTEGRPRANKCTLAPPQDYRSLPMSAAVPAEPAAAEQKGIAAVRIEIDRRRRVVDLGIARRFANCSRTRLLSRTRIDSGGGGNGCCAD